MSDPSPSPSGSSTSPSDRGPPPDAAAIVIGDELLSGKIADENVRVLAQTLRSIGIRLARVLMIPDDRALIAEEVRAFSARYHAVFTSGGVGPTHDDVTVDAVADAFGVEAEVNPELEAMLRAHYGDRMTPGHRHMARAPVGARLVRSESIPWPATLIHNVWVLPGVPQIFRMKMPLVRRELGGRPGFVSVACFCTLDEGMLKPLLDEVVATHPAVAVGSYPKWKHPRYRTQITFDGLEENRVVAARDALCALLPADAIVDEP